MSKKNGSALAIWFSEEERQCLEEASALANYKHLSTYIKDRLFARADYRVTETHDDLAMKFDLVCSDLALMKSMLSFLMMATSQELSSSARLEMVRRLLNCRNEGDALNALGELGQAIEQFSQALE